MEAVGGAPVGRKSAESKIGRPQCLADSNRRRNCWSSRPIERLRAADLKSPSDFTRSDLNY